MTSITSTFNWEAAWATATVLGARTRELVRDLTTQEDVDMAREWALQMARQSDGTRAASYIELAVLLGHSAPPRGKIPTDDERLAWINAQLTSMEEKLEATRDVVARIVAEQDQARAAAEKEAVGHAS
jgi:hypothetical protein